MQTVLYCLAALGFWAVSASLVLWLRDRSGNSGRQSHWKTNPRLGLPSEDELDD